MAQHILALHVLIRITLLQRVCGFKEALAGVHSAAALSADAVVASLASPVVRRTAFVRAEGGVGLEEMQEAEASEAAIDLVGGASGSASRFVPSIKTDPYVVGSTKALAKLFPFLNGARLYNKFAPSRPVPRKELAGLVRILDKSSSRWGEKGYVIPHDVLELAHIGGQGLLGAWERFNRVVAWQLGRKCLKTKFNGKFIGCYWPWWLEQLPDTWTITVEEAYDGCRDILDRTKQGLFGKVFPIFFEPAKIIVTGIDENLNGRRRSRRRLEGREAAIVGSYPHEMNDVVGHILSVYKTRDSNWVTRPTKWGPVENLQMGNVILPASDIDSPRWLAIELYMPGFVHGFWWDAIFPQLLRCSVTTYSRQNASERTLSIEDELDHPWKNQWEGLLDGSQPLEGREDRIYARKKDWFLEYYAQTKFVDGVPAWPTSYVQFEVNFLNPDGWDDGLERSIAFDLIGAHLVESVSYSEAHDVAVAAGVSEESVVLVLQRNQFASFLTRLGFGRYGVDLYFDEDGLPVVLKRPDGTFCKRGCSDWQYYKFVWRSTLITTITVVDHLHVAHYRCGSVVGKTVREVLMPDHPMRRLMSIFTWGTAFINQMAFHLLSFPNNIFHKGTPFDYATFSSLNTLVPESVMAPVEQHKIFLNATLFQAMPALLQQAPYFAHGRELFGALHRLIQRYWRAFVADWTNKDGVLIDPQVMEMLEVFKREAMIVQSHEDSMRTASAVEKDIVDGLTAIVWTLTGWHRHVGTVGDYYADPDLASFSWKDGEAFARPNQHLLVGSVAVFTAFRQPKLNQDFTHVFRTMPKETAALDVWTEFQEELKEVEIKITALNAERHQRGQVENVHAKPSEVECSVAV